LYHNILCNNGNIFYIAHWLIVYCKYVDIVLFSTPNQIVYIL